MELFEAIDKYCLGTDISCLISKSRHVIVGFSGGADSTVLISYFASLRKKSKDLTIVGAHVNHGIRGAEADRDEAFCKHFCESAGIIFECERANVPEIAKKEGKTLEEAARDVRYSFFERLSQKYESSVVATAHNADDNLETVIFHLTRGSGTKGLSGIAPVRDGMYIRPLLSCSSEEIRSFAKESGLDYVTDSTNSDTAYTRNSIRHNVIPVLREINPKVHSAALRLSSSAREDCDFIESEAQRFLESTPTRETMRALHPSVFQRALSLMYKRKAQNGLDLSEKNIADCRRLLESCEGGHISLPHSLAFFADKYSVRIDRDIRGRMQDERSESLSPVTLKEGERVKYGSFYIICEEVTDYVNISEENIYKLSLHTYLDCDRINGDIRVRSRMSGDTFRFRKMTRKLKKLMCDFNVPTDLRNVLPILEDSRGILYVPTVGARDGCMASRDSKRLLHVHVFRDDTECL